MHLDVLESTVSDLNSKPFQTQFKCTDKKTSTSDIGIISGNSIHVYDDLLPEARIKGRDKL